MYFVRFTRILVSDPLTTPHRAPKECERVRGLLLGCRHVPWHQCVVVINGLRQWQSLEQPGQIAVWVDTVCLACLDDRIEISAGVGAIDSVGEQP